MYKLTEDGVQNLETKGFIVESPTGREWLRYQKWLTKGNTPEPEFTEDELSVKKQRKKRQIETAIVDMRLRKDAANLEGFTGLESETQAELDKLRADLMAEEK